VDGRQWTGVHRSSALVAPSPQPKDTKRSRSVRASVWQKHICHNANDALWLACVVPSSSSFGPLGLQKQLKRLTRSSICAEQNIRNKAAKKLKHRKKGGKTRMVGRDLNAYREDTSTNRVSMVRESRVAEIQSSRVQMRMMQIHLRGRWHLYWSNLTTSPYVRLSPAVVSLMSGLWAGLWVLGSGLGSAHAAVYWEITEYKMRCQSFWFFQFQSQISNLQIGVCITRAKFVASVFCLATAYLWWQIWLFLGSGGNRTENRDQSTPLANKALMKCVPATEKSKS